MGRVEADRLHAGLIGSYADVLPRIEGGRVHEHAGYRVTVCPAIPVPGFNGIWVDGPDAPDAFDELRRAVQEVDDAGVPCWVEVRVGASPAFEDAAQRLGFRLEETIPGMVLRRDELVSGSPIPVARVHDEVGLLAALTVAAAGFEVPAGLFAPLYTLKVSASPALAMYIAEIDGEVVSTSTAWTRDGGVGIYNVATPPTHRGHGYGRAVTEYAIRAGFAAGADLAWLQASPLGEPIYRAMGFRQVETYLLFGRGSG